MEGKQLDLFNSQDWTLNLIVNDTFPNNEYSELEYKAALGGFPNDFWKTYSAFANTNGGVIVLDTSENNRDTSENNKYTSDSNKFTSDSNKFTSGNNRDTSGNNRDTSVDLRDTLTENEKRSWVKKEEMENMILNVCKSEFKTLEELAMNIGRNAKYVKNNIIPKLIESGRLERLYPTIINHPHQAYKTKE
ncbi:MAG TPA: ATP-binding protein [Prolixibacteraceae bacterium]